MLQRERLDEDGCALTRPTVNWVTVPDREMASSKLAAVAQLGEEKAATVILLGAAIWSPTTRLVEPARPLIGGKDPERRFTKTGLAKDGQSRAHQCLSNSLAPVLSLRVRRNCPCTTRSQAQT
jgi:hypothetical protein